MTHTLKELLGMKLPEPEQLIGNGVLIRGAKLALYGVFKAGKSTLLTYMALCLAGGVPLFADNGFSTVPSRVLYIQLEMPFLSYVKRLRQTKLADYKEIQNNFITATEFWLKLDTEEGYDWLASTVYKVKPDVMIVDPLYKCVTGDENKSSDMNKVFDNLDKIIQQFNVSLMFTMQGRKTHLTNKGKAVDMGDDELRGSTQIGGWVDSILGIRRDKDTVRLVSFTLRHGDRDQFEIPVVYNKTTGLYVRG
jgi:RecA-family ATPase